MNKLLLILITMMFISGCDNFGRDGDKSQEGYVWEYSVTEYGTYDKEAESWNEYRAISYTVTYEQCAAKAVIKLNLTAGEIKEQEERSVDRKYRVSNLWNISDYAPTCDKVESDEY